MIVEPFMEVTVANYSMEKSSYYIEKFGAEEHFFATVTRQYEDIRISEQPIPLTKIVFFDNKGDMAYDILKKIFAAHYANLESKILYIKKENYETHIFSEKNENRSAFSIDVTVVDVKLNGRMELKSCLKEIDIDENLIYSIMKKDPITLEIPDVLRDKIEEYIGYGDDFG